MAQLDLTMVMQRIRAQGEMLLGATDEEIASRYQATLPQARRWRHSLEGRESQIVIQLERQGDYDLAAMLRSKQRTDGIMANLMDLMPQVSELVPEMVASFGRRLKIYESPEFQQAVLARSGAEGLIAFNQHLHDQWGTYLKLASVSQEGVALGLYDGAVRLPARATGSATVPIAAEAAVEGHGGAGHEGQGTIVDQDGGGDGRGGGTDADSGDGNGSGGNGHQP